MRLNSTKKSKRASLLKAIDTMPDEAFSWLLVAIGTHIWPDGIGGFMPKSRTSIVKVKAEAAKLIGTFVAERGGRGEREP